MRIKAIYDEYHTITMVDGKGTAYDADGKEITSAVVGDKITIVAKDRDSHEFNHWEIDPDNVILEDPNADKTAFTMPDEPVSVEAKYKHLQSITMNHGTAYDEDFSETDIAKAKQTITIKAEDRYADGLVFDHWAVDTDNVILADEYDEKTTFEMVNGAVELTAHYKARVTVFSVPAKFEEGIGEHSDEKRSARPRPSRPRSTKRLSPAWSSITGRSSRQTSISVTSTARPSPSRCLSAK